LRGNSLDNEAFILGECAQGSVAAFNTLFHRYYDQVMGLSLLMTKSPEHAQDLTQEIFTKIWENKEKLAEVRQFRPYLNTVTRNHVRDFLKRKVFVVENDQYFENFFVESAGTAEQLFTDKQMEMHLNEAITRLSPQAREVFTLGRQQGLTHRQISERLKISETTSKSHMVKALAVLRSYMRQLYPDLFQYITIYFSIFF
jgi:RNA polymerase sigma-70 factor (family 1)